VVEELEIGVEDEVEENAPVEEEADADQQAMRRLKLLWSTPASLSTTGLVVSRWMVVGAFSHPKRKFVSICIYLVHPTIQNPSGYCLQTQ